MVTKTEVLDTDREHGEHPDFDMLIDDGHRGELVRMTITIGGWQCSWDCPRSGVIYQIAPPRRKR